MYPATPMSPSSALVTRLKSAMERRQINARELAQSAGVGASFVYDILGGKSRNPTGAKLGAVAEVLGVSIGWLLEGEESAPAVAPIVTIPPIAIEVTASGISVVTLQENASPWRFHRDWLEHELKVPVERLRAIEIRDDSMAPTLEQGDMVLVDMGSAPENPQGVYVLLDRLGLAVRRISPTADAGNLTVAADNSAIAARMLPAAELHILGRVVWSARKFV